MIADEKDAFDDALAAEIEISVLGLWPRILGYSCLGAALLSEENCDVTTNYSFFKIYPERKVIVQIVLDPYNHFLITSTQVS